MTGRNVLIVDDDPEIAELLAAVLELYGFAARTVNCGLDGVRVALEHRPDAIILDLMLPDIDGVEVCRRLRSDERGKDTAVMLLTAALGDQHRQRALDAGVNRYMNKPFDAEGIVRELIELMESTVNRPPVPPVN